MIVGGHLDHLGLNPVLMPGAHDNASGAAVTLAVAEALAKAKLPMKRSVLFILFGAEEQGVKGSEYYVAHPFIPNAKVKAFINLESVGRGERIGVGSGRNYPEIYEVMDRMNAKYIASPDQREPEREPRAAAAGCGALPVGEHPDGVGRRVWGGAAALPELSHDEGPLGDPDAGNHGRPGAGGVPVDGGDRQQVGRPRKPGRHRPLPADPDPPVRRRGGAVARVVRQVAL